ncbi:MAG: helix-turn-helix domain-containing protein [Mangrovibacterium sp.]
MIQNYTLEEAAEKLKIPVPTFRKYRPQIGGSKIGRRWVFSEQELLSFMDRKRSKPIHELQSA